MLPTELPFYFKSHDALGNGGFPASLPFELYYDETLKMYCQKPTTDLKNTLEEVYKLGSLVDGSISNESGWIYVDKTIEYIKEQLPDLEQKKVLEIGCGNGILLKSLQATGAELIGLEPGDHGIIEGLAKEIIIRDFFPTTKIVTKFDLLINFFVLEHIQDPVSFLKEAKEYLTKDGKIIFGVPNCEPFLETGDISIFIHEHYNYFTKESILPVISKAGLHIQDMRIIEGMLIVTLSKNVLAYEQPYIMPFNKTDFEKKVEILNEKILDLFNYYDENEIAVYVPGRALNTMFLAKKNNCRLVDDNSEIHGKYLPYFNNSIESFDQLIDSPPKCILIYSRTFGERIKTKCLKRAELRLTKVISLNDLD